MHPQNPYRIPPDFATLAEKYPPLRLFLIDVLKPDTSRTSTTIDFKNEEALRCLTEAIMLLDFGVKLTVPGNRLCPPVPNRMNYVLWIQDIVAASRRSLDKHPRNVRGIDIGTGANAIYPFLACKTNDKWGMVGTEIDDFSYACAFDHVENNNMQDKITIQKASVDRPILFPLEDASLTNPYDFTMCNPPFYASSEEVKNLAGEKDGPPAAVCTGAEIEMIYADGGEVGFVERMVEESVRYQGRCRWYTSMLGKMSSVTKIIDILHAHSITNYAVTEFIQGQTRRWAVGWSFLDGRLPDSIGRISVHPSHALSSYMPSRNTLLHSIGPQNEADITLENISQRLRDSLNLLERVHFTHEDGENPILFVEAESNTWSRSARRKQKRAAAGEGVKIATPHDKPLEASLGPALACTVTIVQSSESASNEGVHREGPEEYAHAAPSMMVTMQGDERMAASGEATVHSFYSVEFQWVYGTDRGLFESFSSHVGRKVGATFNLNCVNKL